MNLKKILIEILKGFLAMLFATMLALISTDENWELWRIFLNTDGTDARTNFPERATSEPY